MAITMAQIKAEMHVRTLRTDVTDITDELRAILYNITNAFPFIEESTNVTISANGYSAALPDYCRRVMSVVDSDGKALERLPDYATLARWRLSTIAAGVPRRWALYDRTLYVHPKAATSTTLTVNHSSISGDVNTIALPDEFSEALIEGVCYKVLESKGLIGEPQAQGHKSLYEEELKRLSQAYADRNEGQVVPNQLGKNP